MEPLAYRMKPTTLDEFVGQEEIIGKDKLLYRLIKADKLTSAIFWGPPGCGKTSLARIIANTTKYKFVSLTVFKFKELTNADVVQILKNCVNNKEKGLGNYNLNIEDGTLEFLASNSNGDVRAVLNALELAVLTTEMDKDGKIIINKDVIANCIQQKRIIYDKSDDSHYDIISAFIKSMRGSDPDATIHYLARML